MSCKRKLTNDTIPEHASHKKQQRDVLPQSCTLPSHVAALNKGWTDYKEVDAELRVFITCPSDMVPGVVRISKLVARSDDKSGYSCSDRFNIKYKYEESNEPMYVSIQWSSEDGDGFRESLGFFECFANSNKSWILLNRVLVDDFLIFSSTAHHTALVKMPLHEDSEIHWFPSKDNTLQWLDSFTLGYPDGRNATFDLICDPTVVMELLTKMSIPTVLGELIIEFYKNISWSTFLNHA